MYVKVIRYYLVQFLKNRDKLTNGIATANFTVKKARLKREVLEITPKENDVKIEEILQ